MSTAAVEHARQMWEEGYRRLRAHSSDPVLFDRLSRQVDTIIDELHRRLGQTFTLAQLADAYRDADHWLPQALPPGGAGHSALVQDAAFHRHARGAVDYVP